MSGTKVQWRGGTTSQHNSFTGADREVTVDTTKKTLVVHDGSKQGGYPLATEADLQSLGSASSADIVQGTGSSTTDVMSQKAVSDQLLGVGQTWHSLTGDRSKSTTYTNTTGRPIIVTVVGMSVSDGQRASIRLLVDGVIVDFCQITDDSQTANAYPNVSAVVPDGSSYKVERGAYDFNIYYWRELR